MALLIKYTYNIKIIENILKNSEFLQNCETSWTRIISLLDCEIEVNMPCIYYSTIIISCLGGSPLSIEYVTYHKIIIYIIVAVILIIHIYIDRPRAEATLVYTYLSTSRYAYV